MGGHVGRRFGWICACASVLQLDHGGVEGGVAGSMLCIK